MRAWLVLLVAGCGGDTTAAPDPVTDTEDLAPEDADQDGWVVGQDCDDRDATRYPGAPERCDGLDQDCDPEVDEGFDVDRDGWLTGLDAGCAALGPTDCDDADAAVHPNAVETCDGQDEDCDGVVDLQVDGDDDGALLCEDCDDADDAIRPGAAELCDGRDNDCNGLSDEGSDADGDGWGDCLDCDDDDLLVHPEAVEVCDARDNDCDGTWDEGFDADADGFATCRGDCDDGDEDANPWANERCNGRDDDCNGVVDDKPDRDEDGFLPCAQVDGDCDDRDPLVFPGAEERCDGADDDCDGVVPPDEVDADLDGVATCDGDCDDGDPERAPDQRERCDGQDNDCDATTGEQEDEDGDQLTVCEGDCDDRRITTNPQAPERCNAIDDDCSGAVDDAGVCAPCEVVVWSDHTYLFCEGRETWGDARDACRADGYALVTVGDALENEFVTTTAAGFADRPWWLGLSDRTDEDEFVWVDGDASEYRAWGAGQPDDSGTEDCVELHSPDLSWNDRRCDDQLPFVCETAGR